MSSTPYFVRVGDLKRGAEGKRVWVMNVHPRVFDVLLMLDSMIPFYETFSLCTEW